MVTTLISDKNLFKALHLVLRLIQPFAEKTAKSQKTIEVLWKTHRKEILKGRIRGPFLRPPFDNFICSPLGLIPKKEKGSFRLIHDLSFPKGDSVNSWTPPEYTMVSYQNIETVIE